MRGEQGYTRVGSSQTQDQGPENPSPERAVWYKTISHP